MDVVLTEQAQRDFDELPLSMKKRVLGVFVRLGGWPNVSGAKWLTGDWHGFARVRTGDWRVIVRPEGGQIIGSGSRIAARSTNKEHDQCPN